MANDIKTKEPKKIRILFFGDSPRTATGFASVSRGILNNLALTGRYKIDIFGVNDLGFLDPDPEKYPYRILPASIPGMQGDFYGRMRFINILRGADMFLKPSWDIVFTLNDPFIFEEPILTQEVGTMDAIHDISKIYRKDLSPEHWNKICCFTPDTQIFTENGIKLIHDVKKGEKVYTINPETMEKELSEIEDFYEYDYEDKLFNLKAEGINFQVTSEHRFLLSTTKYFKKGKYLWLTAKEIQNRKYRGKEYKGALYFPETDQPIKGESKEYFELLPYLPDNQEVWIYGDINKFKNEYGIKGERISKSTHNGKYFNDYEKRHLIISLKDCKKIINKINDAYEIKFKQKRKSKAGLQLRYKMKDWLSLMGWYISEGYTSEGRLIICQSKDSEYDSTISGLLKRMNLSFTRDKDRFRISEPILADILKKECGHGAVNKKIPMWIFKLDYFLLEYLLESLMFGDGSKDRIYTTISKKLTEQIMQLCLHLGKNTTLLKKKEINKGGGYKGKYDIYTVVIRKMTKNGFYRKHYSWNNYKGKVYCVKVKKNHTVFAGRNGKFQFIGQSYWPVDSYLKENWITHAIGLPDYSVAYTNYGKSEIEKANQKSQKPMEFNLDVIYHGTDTIIFHPLPKEEILEFKKKFFKKASIDIEKTFIVGVVARNQMRKDLPRVMKIFKEFQKRRPDSMLYIHAKESDVGGSLSEYARALNLELGKDWIFPGNFNENTGYPAEALNSIYNSMDVQVQCSNGEGWCLPITEAMAAKTLNIAPNITSIPELFNTESNNIEDLLELETNETLRGIPIKSGSTSSEWTTFGPTDYERIRPLTNVDDAVKKLIWVYDNPEKAQKIADRAYEWIQQYSWEIIAQKWDEFFQKVYADLEEERAKPIDKKVEPQVEETPK